MATFRYRGYSAEGTRRQGYIEAESAKLALRALAAEGVFAEQVTPVSSRGEKLRKSRRAALYRELAALLEAGLTLEHALSLLIGEGANRDTASILMPVRDALREGQSLAAALKAADSGMADFETAAIAAAERTASLPRMFMQLAEHLETSDEALERLRSAAIYPTFVLLLGIGVAVLLLGVLVPRAQAALAAGGMTLPAASLLVVRGARLAALLGAAAVLLLGATGVAVSALCQRDPERRRGLHRRLLQLPGIGRLVARLAAARFASTLAVLSKADVPLVDGLVLAGQATGNLYLKERVAEAAEEVRQGEAPSQAVERVKAISPWLTEWMRVGEAGGCLDAMLLVAAQRAQSGWEKAMSRLLTLFEPLVLVCVGLFVLAVALAVLLPVTSLTRAIG